MMRPPLGRTSCALWNAWAEGEGGFRARFLEAQVERQCGGAGRGGGPGGAAFGGSEGGSGPPSPQSPLLVALLVAKASPAGEGITPARWGRAAAGDQGKARGIATIRSVAAGRQGCGP
jgi:hypothetical protein